MKKQKKPTIQKRQKLPQRISSDDLAALSGLTDRRHRQLADAGHIPQPTNGEYETVPTLAGLFRYLIGSRDARSKELQQARIEKAQAQARIARVDADLAEKRTVLFDDVKRAIFASTISAKSKFYQAENTIPVEAGMKLALSADEQATLRGIIHAHHHRALTELFRNELGPIICPHCNQEIKNEK